MATSSYPLFPENAVPSHTTQGISRWWIPSLLDCLYLSLLYWMFAGGPSGWLGLLAGGDTGWHIRTGEWIIAHGAVPKADPFSFSKPGEPWFAWEWLSDVLMAWLNSVDGLRAVLLASIAMICATFTLLLPVCRLNC